MARYLLFIEDGSISPDETEYVEIKALGITEISESWSPSQQMVDLAAVYGMQLAVYNPSDPSSKKFDAVEDAWFLNQGKVLYDNLARRILAPLN